MYVHMYMLLLFIYDLKCVVVVRTVEGDDGHLPPVQPEAGVELPCHHCLQFEVCGWLWLELE